MASVGPIGGEQRSERPTSSDASLDHSFAEELAEAFRRRRPQGSLRWNFGVAFTRLEETLAAREEVIRDDSSRQTETVGRRGALRRLVNRLRPWVHSQAREAAREVIAEERSSSTGGFGSTVEALRFLAARVEILEEAARRQEAPIDGLAWLAQPPALEHWAEAIREWFAASASGGAEVGHVLHAECGDGALTQVLRAGLAPAGWRVSGADPRGGLAAACAARGVETVIRSAADALAACPPGSLRGLVLAGSVDRNAVEANVALVRAAAIALTPGAPLVLVGTTPAVADAQTDRVAWDLLPGKPLHAATWMLLLERAGFGELGRLEAAAHLQINTVAVRARRTS